jgi:hypothetical protein
LAASGLSDQAGPTNLSLVQQQFGKREIFQPRKQKAHRSGRAWCRFLSHIELYGAGKETRTLDLYLGKVSLYQLSYSRIDSNQQRIITTGFQLDGLVLYRKMSVLTP